MHTECPALLGLQETNTTVAAVKQFMTFHFKFFIINQPRKQRELGYS